MKWTPEKQQAIEAGALVLWNNAPPGTRLREFVTYGRVASGYIFTLEAVNDTEWGEIVRAAAEAERASGKGCDLCAEDFPLREADGMHYGSQRKGMIPDEPCALSVDPLALFSALLLEGLAKGEKPTQGQNATHELRCSCADCKFHREHYDDCAKCGRRTGPHDYIPSAPAPVPSWFDEHARFELPAPTQGVTTEYRNLTRPFIIPLLTFTYDDGAGQ